MSTAFKSGDFPRHLRSQSSIEFFTLVSLAFIIAIFFVGLSASEARDFRDQKEFLLVKDLALRLQKEVSIAASVEEGYERSFSLPDRLDSSVDYSMTTTNTSIAVNSSRAVFSAAISLVSGNFTKGSNTIEKASGKVYINR